MGTPQLAVIFPQRSHTRRVGTPSVRGSGFIGRKKLRSSLDPGVAEPGLWESVADLFFKFSLSDTPCALKIAFASKMLPLILLKGSEFPQKCCKRAGLKTWPSILPRAA